VEKILEGNLARFEIPDLLTFLNMARRTGVLVLEHPEQETKVFFRDGKPIFATSTKEELRIGAMLVRQGKVEASQLAGLLGKPRAPGQRIGEVLLSEHVLTPEELASFLKVQVSEVIFDTFQWRQGVFTFWDNIPPPATAVTLEMDLQNLVMEGVRRIDDRSRLSELFPDLNMVAEAVANPERVKVAVTLTPEEWRVLFLVDGRRSLSEICRLSGASDELQTLQILYNLVVANLVAVVPPLPGPPSAAEEPAIKPGEYTQRMPAERTSTPAPVAVEFVGRVPQRPTADDTHEIVSSHAVRYLAEAKKLTVSRLVLAEKDRPESSFPLAKDSSTLGRHRNNDIVIADPKVSSFHARIDRSPDGFVLVDLKSRNGSWVNGKRVDTRLLVEGDEIRVGTARLVYRVDYTSQS
jgi:Domain of unknown function (DUF4388)/FHA domain